MKLFGQGGSGLATTHGARSGSRAGRPLPVSGLERYGAEVPSGGKPLRVSSCSSNTRQIHSRNLAQRRGTLLSNHQGPISEHRQPSSVGSWSALLVHTSTRLTAGAISPAQTSTANLIPINLVNYFINARSDTACLNVLLYMRPAQLVCGPNGASKRDTWKGGLTVQNDFHHLIFVLHRSNPLFVAAISRHPR